MIIITQINIISNIRYAQIAGESLADMCIDILLAICYNINRKEVRK